MGWAKRDGAVLLDGVDRIAVSQICAKDERGRYTFRGVEMSEGMALVVDEEVYLHRTDTLPDLLVIYDGYLDLFAGIFVPARMVEEWGKPVDPWEFKTVRKGADL